MYRCADVQMCRCTDVQMYRCTDVQMAGRVDRRAEGRTDMANLIVASRNFVNASKIASSVVCVFGNHFDIISFETKFPSDL